MTKDDVIKIIDGIPFYNYDYIGFLYNKLQEKDKQLKIYKSIIEKLTKELKTTYNKEYYYKYNGKYLKSEINTELLNLLESRGN